MTTKTISFQKLLTFTTPCEKALVVVGMVGAVLAGLFDPLMCYLLSKLLDDLDPYQDDPNLLDEFRQTFFLSIGFGCAIWVFSYIHYAFWQHLAEQVTFDLRKRYLVSLLNQEPAYFESQQLAALPSLIGQNFLFIKQGLGQKFSNIVQVVSNVLFSLCLSLYLNIYVALIGYAFLSLFGLSFVLSLRFTQRTERSKEAADAKLSGTVEETLTAMRVVAAFSLEDQICARYQESAERQLREKLRDEWVHSFFVGVTRSLNYAINPYLFLITSKMLVNGVLNPRTSEYLTLGEIFAILFLIKFSISAMLSIQPNKKAYTQALLAGTKIFEVIEREPKLRDHPGCSDTFTLNDSITFSDITFRFPTPESKCVLEHATFSFLAGKNNGVVGKSGLGKSTIVQLVNRFYEVAEGQILFDGVSNRDIKLDVLRNAIGFVSQEPALLIGTIRDNMLFSKNDATEAEIISALELADAKFVFELPQGLDTYVGSSTVQNMSGGQKQKISIARALLKAPKLLILDEATSALDVASEREILQSVEGIRRVRRELTIITIAHRMETIRMTDRILWLQGENAYRTVDREEEEFGRILEQMEKEAEQSSKLEQDYLDIHGTNDHSILSSRSSNPAPNTDSEMETMREMLKQLPQRQLEEPDSPKLKTPTKAVQQDREEIEGPQQSSQVGFRRIMQYYKGYSYVVFGFAIAFINALKVPLDSVLRIKIAFLYFEDIESEGLLDDIYYYCYWYLGLVVVQFTIEFFHRYLFSYLGEHLSYRVRQELFQTIVHKPLSWFDDERRQSGILGSLLCEKVYLLNSLTTESITILVESGMLLLAGLLISFYFSWQFTLFILLTVPFLVSGNLIMAQLSPHAGTAGAGNGSSKAKKKEDCYEKSNSLLSDAIMNYKTVISFGQTNVKLLLEKFNGYLVLPRDQEVKQAHKAGIAYGYSAFFRLFYFGILFYFGAFLVTRSSSSTEDITQAVSTIFFCALNSGMNLTNMPSLAKGKAAAKAIFEIIDEKGEEHQVRSQIPMKSGEICFQRVNFTYPSRFERVLRNFSMFVPGGKKVAIVGFSGSGKSTIVNLLLQFYRVREGQLLVDGVPIQQYDLKFLRGQIGYVMQEPMLFNASIKQNIKYGSEPATDLMIYQAAKKAQALQFIESNLEDLGSEEKLKQTTRNLQRKVEELTGEFRNLTQLIVDVVEPRSIQLSYDLLFHSSKDILELIDNNYDMFLKCLSIISGKAKASWEQLLLIFEFHCLEVPKMLSYAHLSPSQLLELQKAIEDLPGAFNFDTVKQFCKMQELEEKSSPKSLKQFIKEDKKRIHSLFERRLDSLIDPSTFQLSDGFNRLCGPKGSHLSGGQKQRIAIARALIKDPKILVLDEATSALDEANQMLVQKALDKAMEGRTSVVIAHRLSTIRNCDWIYVMQQGQIVEQGTFHQLSTDENSYLNRMQRGAAQEQENK